METFPNLFAFLFYGVGFGLTFDVVIHYLFQVVNLKLLPNFLGGREE